MKNLEKKYVIRRVTGTWTYPVAEIWATDEEFEKINSACFDGDRRIGQVNAILGCSSRERQTGEKTVFEQLNINTF